MRLRLLILQGIDLVVEVISVTLENLICLGDGREGSWVREDGVKVFDGIVVICLCQYSLR